MMLINIMCICVPLGYSITNIISSGVGVSDAYRWVPEGVFSNPCNVAFNVTCKICVDRANYDPDTTVCFRPPSGPYSGGVETEIDELCNYCPSGCGPFRHLDSAYSVILDEFQTWPPVVRTVVDFIGTMSFGIIWLIGLITWLLVLKAKNGAQTKLIKKLRLERDLERLDKIWILERWAITLDGKRASRSGNPRK